MGMAAWSQPDSGMEQGGTGLEPGLSLAFLALKNFARSLKLNWHLRSFGNKLREDGRVSKAGMFTQPS